MLVLRYYCHVSRTLRPSKEISPTIFLLFLLSLSRLRTKPNTILSHRDWGYNTKICPLLPSHGFLDGDSMTLEEWISHLPISTTWMHPAPLFLPLTLYFSIISTISEFKRLPFWYLLPSIMHQNQSQSLSLSLSPQNITIFQKEVFFFSPFPSLCSFTWMGLFTP